MSRESLSAADAITFLDKVDCDHCEFRGTKKEVHAHSKAEHYRREMGDNYRDSLSKGSLSKKDAYLDPPLITSPQSGAEVLTLEAMRKQMEALRAENRDLVRRLNEYTRPRHVELPDEEAKEIARARAAARAAKKKQEDEHRKNLILAAQSLINNAPDLQREYLQSRLTLFKRGAISEERLRSALGFDIS